MISNTTQNRLENSKSNEPIISVKDWRENVVSDTSSISKSGYRWVGITLLVFFAWALWVPISSAVVSSGKIVATGQNKLLQHPTGGVVVRINAKEGEQIQKGELIVEVEPALEQAELARLLARQNLLLAQEARLNSSKTGFKVNVRSDNIQTSNLQIDGIMLRGTVHNSTEKFADNSNYTNAVFEEQETEYKAATVKFDSQLSALENQFVQLEQDFSGLQLQIHQQQMKTNLIARQYRKLKPLASAGYIASARLWDIETQMADSKSQLASQKARSGTLKASMSEVNDRIVTLEAQKIEDNAKERSAVLAELEGVTEQINAAQTALEYSQIKASVTGTLIKLTANTIGGVVSPGAVIGEIVPADQPLLVEARISPADIAEVELDQEVDVIVTAFNRRIHEPLTGRVTYVSADSSLDELTGESYFVTRIALENMPASTPKLLPGMVTEVYVKTASRSFLSYVSAPVLESMRKAFNER